jgi:hypothetical protein
MKNPSIEASLSRKVSAKSYPIARYLDRLPYVGTMARAWVRSTRSDRPTMQWAALPPLAA